MYSSTNCNYKCQYRDRQMNPKLLALIIVVVCMVGIWRNKLNSIHNLNSNTIKDKLKANCGHRIANSDDVLLYNNGYSSLKNKQFLEYLRNRIIVDPSEQNINLTNSEKLDFSQLGQSRFVDDLLGQKKNGFFLECGAADGEKFSNSLFFELERHWTGILIEPNSGFFKTLLSKRRNVYAINGCLSTSNKTEMVPFINSRFLGGIDANFTDKRAYTSYHRYNTEVQCFPIMAILYALGNPMIDYFSLDVEGAELLILDTIVWGDVHIDVFTIEHNNRKHIINDLRKLFELTGLYKEIHFQPGQDIVFKRQD